MIDGCMEILQTTGHPPLWCRCPKSSEYPGRMVVPKKLSIEITAVHHTIVMYLGGPEIVKRMMSVPMGSSEGPRDRAEEIPQSFALFTLSSF